MADRTQETPPPATLEERRKLRHESRVGSTYKHFLKDLCAMGGFDEALAEQAASSVLCTLSRRVHADEAKDLVAQLPLKLQELLQSCLTHGGKPEKKFGREELLRMVGDDLGKSPEEVEPLVRAVIQTVHHQISEGEVQQFGNMLPRDIAELWFHPAVH